MKKICLLILFSINFAICQVDTNLVEGHFNDLKQGVLGDFLRYINDYKNKIASLKTSLEKDYSQYTDQIRILEKTITLINEFNEKQIKEWKDFNFTEPSDANLKKLLNDLNTFLSDFTQFQSPFFKERDVEFYSLLQKNYSEYIELYNNLNTFLTEFHDKLIAPLDNDLKETPKATEVKDSL